MCDHEDCKAANKAFEGLHKTGGGKAAEDYLKELDSTVLEGVHGIIHMHILDVGFGVYDHEPDGRLKRASALASMHRFVKLEELRREKGYVTEEDEKKITLSNQQLLASLLGIPIDNIMVVEEGSKVAQEIGDQGIRLVSKEQFEATKPEDTVAEQAVTPENVTRVIDELLNSIPMPKNIFGEQKKLPPA